ncbi:MAG: DUF3299 domain-containing protein [Planctomycetota bacterium]|nr:DUF3299 domain-containing protein [Planctomycetota bacterium]MDA1113170.1 DUF3299 domain-containing protein [Planctomycetota bacterium]
MSNRLPETHRFLLRTAPVWMLALTFMACTKEEARVELATEVVEQTTRSVDKAAAAPEAEAEAESEGEAQAEEEETAAPKSLRDRITTTLVAEGSRPTWSLATTPEERRANIEKAMATKSEPYAIDLHDLGGWELDEREENPIPDFILDLDGKEFVMRGFMMPDIDFEHIRSFHLVRSLFSCCFGAPPQINEIMRVTLADEEGMDYTYNTLEVRGRLTVTFEVVDGLVEDIFRLEDVTYRILEFDDPDAPDSFDENTGFDSVIPSGSQEY